MVIIIPNICARRQRRSVNVRVCRKWVRNTEGFSACSASFESEDPHFSRMFLGDEIWEATALPLSYTRARRVITRRLAHKKRPPARRLHATGGQVSGSRGNFPPNFSYSGSMTEIAFTTPRAKF